MTLDNKFPSATTVDELLLILARDFPAPKHQYTLGSCHCGRFRCNISCINLSGPKVMEITAEGSKDVLFLSWEADVHAPSLVEAISKAIGEALSKQQ